MERCVLVGINLVVIELFVECLWRDCAGLITRAALCHDVDQYRLNNHSFEFEINNVMIFYVF